MTDADWQELNNDASYTSADRRGRALALGATALGLAAMIFAHYYLSGCPETEEGTPIAVLAPR